MGSMALMWDIDDTGLSHPNVKNLSRLIKDYVVSSGSKHSVKDFVDAACSHLLMETEWRMHGNNDTKHHLIELSTGKNYCQNQP